MHIHPPKPVHGWRAFLGEVGIIVIGVGIALGAEALIEEQHWRDVVAEDSKALDGDIAGIWETLTHRVAVQPCVDRRLADIGIVLARHDAGKPLGLIGPIGRPAQFTAGETALAIATADQALSHMPLERKEAYFRVYGSYDIFAPANREERDTWRKLQALNHPATLTLADWMELRRAFDAASDSNVAFKANLTTSSSGAWLTPFKQFPPLPIDRTASGLPYEVQLCAPALAA